MLTRLRRRGLSPYRRRDDVAGRSLELVGGMYRDV